MVAVTTGLAPQFTISTSAGGQDVPNPNLQDDFKATMSFVQGGTYLVSVSSASGMTGQFVIRISDANSQQPSQPELPSLAMGQTVNGTLNNGQATTYLLTGSTSSLVLMVQGNVSAALQNAAGETLGTLASGLDGGAFFLSAGGGTYQLQLSNNTGVPLAYAASLNQLNGQPLGGGQPTAVPTAIIATPSATAVPLPVLPSSGACMLATAQSNYVNVRSAPSTNDAIVGQIHSQSTYSVVGRNADSSWYQIDYGGGTGWVAGYVTRHGGDCFNLPVTYTPPPTPTLMPNEGGGDNSGDNGSLNLQIPYQKGYTVSRSGTISYPGEVSVRSATVSYQIINIPASIPKGVIFSYHISCTGDYQYVQTTFGHNSPNFCTPDGLDFPYSFDGTGYNNDTITFTMIRSNNTTAQWHITFSWDIP